MSNAGKGILIKTCLQAYPMYIMQCLKLPRALCKRLSSISVKFWWAGHSKSKGIHWVNKDVNVMQKDKIKGGMGFRCFESLNNALLMKQLWRLISCPNSLVTKVLKAKYFKDGNILECASRISDSYIWKSICSVRNIFREGLDENELRYQRLRWKISSCGTYTVKSGYELAVRWKLSMGNDTGESSNLEEVQRFWKKVWRLQVPDRIKIMTWKLFHNAIQVYENLKKKGCSEGGSCSFCGYKYETIEHIFIQCWWIKEMWRALHLQQSPSLLENNFTDWLWWLISTTNSGEVEVAMVTLWVVWKNRNLRVHEKRGWSIEECLWKVQNYVRSFKKKNVGAKVLVGDEPPVVMIQRPFIVMELGRGRIL